MGLIDLDTGQETKLDVPELVEKAKWMRAAALCAIHAGKSGHPGGSLSIMDIAAALYLNVARHAPKNPDWEERDLIFFSAGHKAPALYAALAASGYYSVEEIMTFRRFGTPFQGHPHRLKTKGVEVSSGSLGQGLGIAVGAALGCRLNGQSNRRVYCIMGDGEQQEGSIWEAAMSAGQFKVDNLCGIVDKNRLQIDGWTDDVMCIDPLDEKYRAFNWHVIHINGHDMVQILAAFEEAARTKGKPTVIIADTVKGKGVGFMENQAGWHGVPTTKREQLDEALADIGAEGFPKEVVDKFIDSSQTFADSMAAAVDELMPKFSRDYWWNVRENMQVDMEPTRMGFGRCMERIGEDPRVVTLHADISGSIRITGFEENHPERLNRVFSVGIAEQNMMQVAAGLSLLGYIPVTGTYGVFASGRCWDQIRTTICYSELNVKIAGAHGGISVGPDGATHQSLEEISVMGVLPNMTLVVPADAVQTDRLSKAAILDIVGPAYIRYAREATPIISKDDTPLVLGKANVIRFRGEADRFIDAFETVLAEEYQGEGEEICIAACGPMVPEAMRAAWILKSEFDVETRVLNIHTVKPLDKAAIVKAARDCRIIITAEEHQAGGFGSFITGVVAANVDTGEPVIVEQIGVCGFGESGDPWVLMKSFGLTAEHIANRAKMLLHRRGNPKVS
ncbi:MAG: transketolase [Candidatus Zipacnadales bacterium]